MNDPARSRVERELRRLRLLAICILAALLVLIAVQVRHDMRFGKPTVYGGPPLYTWRKVRDYMDNAQYQYALDMARELTKQHPHYEYGYRCQGTAHLALGETSKAESAFAKAYDLFPSEENKETLAAVRAALMREPGAGATPREDPSPNPTDRSGSGR
jgi:tetratricopeptide (TPR) repeat protein